MKTPRFHTWFFGLATAVCLPHASTAPIELPDVTEIPWNVARLDLVANQSNVGSILEAIGREQGITLTVGEKVEGLVSGEFKDVKAQSLLDALCEAHNLSWFYDGATIYVDRDRDRLTRHQISANVTADDFKNVAYGLGLTTGPGGRGGIVRSGTRSGFLTISGIPSFVIKAEALIGELDQQEETRLNEQIVSRQFRLEHASASDATVDTGSTTTQIPGVARILQEMLGVQGGGALSTGNVRFNSPSRVVSRRELGETAATALGLSAAIDADTFTAQPIYNEAPTSDGEEGSDFEPSITANSRLNAVVIRDFAGRIPLYEELIKELDVPIQVIQIRASIVDVRAANRREFSTEFLGSYTTDSGDIRRFGFDADRGIFDGNDTQGQIPSFIDGSDLVRGVGGRVSTILTGSNWELLTRVKALEEKGIAQLVTSPQILTEENRAASIRFDETVYVRLVGERDVDLTPVTTGTELRVTPSVVRENGEMKFSLEIEITDGSFTDDSVDEIPTTQESAITTRAVIPANRTLLLGGNTIMRNFKNDRQVPFLGDIPIAGRLFGAREKDQAKAQRFFFLTPELINVKLDSRPMERESPHEIPGGNMEMTRLIPLPYDSPTRVEDHARNLDYGTTSTMIPPYLGPKPEKTTRYFPFPVPFDFKGKLRRKLPVTSENVHEIE